MKPINIFRVSRISDERLFNIAARHEASDHDNHNTPVHEIESLRIFADAMASRGVTVSEADGFYFGFIIPVIGKEFDLLKVTGKYCLNIELKSQNVSEGQIAAQLRKNRHYLTLLGRELMLFTVVTDSLTCYRLTEDDELERVEIKAIARAVKKCGSAYHGRIDILFKPSDYLISPEKTPEKFIAGQYFLSPAQEQVKAELLRSIAGTDPHAFFHFTGRPCSGKTLLIYDLARHLAIEGNTLIICAGKVSGGLITIRDSIDRIDIRGTGDIISPEQLSGFDFILTDETLRMPLSVFDTVCRSAEAYGQICVFSTDPSSLLTSSESEQHIMDRIHSLDLAGEFALTERLRMNMELFTFIMKLRNLSARTDHTYEFEHVSVNYANDADEARNMIRYFRDKGYVFINACVRGCSDAICSDPFGDISEDFGSQRVAGREYSKVVLLMDDSFCYDENGYLKGIPEPDPDDLYPNVFYQDITRVRDRLALVILDAPELLSSILSIIS